jgi:hypothetical protein
MPSNPFLTSHNTTSYRSTGSSRRAGTPDTDELGGASAVLASLGLTEEEVTQLFAEAVVLPIGDPTTGVGIVDEQSFAAKTATFLADLMVNKKLSTAASIKYGKWLYGWQNWKNAVLTEHQLSDAVRLHLFSFPVNTPYAARHRTLPKDGKFFDSAILRSLFKMV